VNVPSWLAKAAKVTIGEVVNADHPETLY
jgi:hypothetical protein